jgi:hypothetical protein
LLFELESLPQQSFIPAFEDISLVQDFLFEWSPHAKAEVGIRKTPSKTISKMWIFFIFTLICDKITETKLVQR